MPPDMRYEPDDGKYARAWQICPDMMAMMPPDVMANMSPDMMANMPPEAMANMSPDMMARACRYDGNDGM